MSFTITNSIYDRKRTNNENLKIVKEEEEDKPTKNNIIVFLIGLLYLSCFICLYGCYASKEESIFPTLIKITNIIFILFQNFVTITFYLIVFIYIYIFISDNNEFEKKIDYYQYKFSLFKCMLYVWILFIIINFIFTSNHTPHLLSPLWLTQKIHPENTFEVQYLPGLHQIPDAPDSLKQRIVEWQINYMFTIIITAIKNKNKTCLLTVETLLAATNTFDYSTPETIKNSNFKKYELSIEQVKKLSKIIANIIGNKTFTFEQIPELVKLFHTEIKPDIGLYNFVFTSPYYVVEEYLQSINISIKIIDTVNFKIVKFIESALKNKSASVEDIIFTYREAACIAAILNELKYYNRNNTIVFLQYGQGHYFETWNTTKTGIYFKKIVERVKDESNYLTHIEGVQGYYMKMKPANFTSENFLFKKALEAYEEDTT